MFARNLVHKMVSGYAQNATKFNFPRINTNFPRYHYDNDDGKMTINILNKELDHGLMINAFSQVGFRLNNNINIVGPMVIFPRTVLSWNVENLEDINEKSLSLFCALEPKIDVLVIGTGDQPSTPSFSRSIVAFMQKFKINVEVLRTEQACATFNFLNSEGRIVAGALIPPNILNINENDIARSKVRNSKLYEIDDD